MLAQERVRGPRGVADPAWTWQVYSQSLLPASRPPTPASLPLPPQDMMTDRHVCSGDRGVCAGAIDHPALGATQLCGLVLPLKPTSQPGLGGPPGALNPGVGAPPVLPSRLGTRGADLSKTQRMLGTGPPQGTSLH